MAHAARPMALAAALPRERYEATVAVPEQYARWRPQHLRQITLEAQAPDIFAERLRAGRPMFSKSRLEGYVVQDLDLIRETRPDVIVGDFRLSLPVSAGEAGVPYVALSNAYWSPDRPFRAVRPTLDLFRDWPAPLADAAFHALAPTAFRWHARPVQDLMTAHGFDGIDGDVRRAFTQADVALYADLPGLFPDIVESPGRRFLGPVTWEPPVEAPAWWGELQADAPIAYLTLGSSGDPRNVEPIARWLLDAGFTVMTATAGRIRLEGDERRLFVADYLPGLAACRRAALVVCNGGSPTVTQALVEGRPVLGICINMDQFLNMRAVQSRGAGLALRADRLTRSKFENALARLDGRDFAATANTLACEARALDPAAILAQTLDHLCA